MINEFRKVLIADFRSDSVPDITPEMSAAMSSAVVGDLVLGHDESVEQLEDSLKQTFGMHAVWMPTCTMANLAALMLCGRGGPTEVLVGNTSHINTLERMSATTFAGIALRSVPDPLGRLEPAVVEEQITSDSEFTLAQSCIALENTHNLAGGAVFDPLYLQTMYTLASRRELRIHVDGARIFNASVALNVALDSWCPPSTVTSSMALSLTKALGTPAGGALLLSSPSDIVLARRYRKALGGTMHCGAGILAAAAVPVLSASSMVDIRGQILRSHRLAAIFALEVEGIGGFEVLTTPMTNIVYVRDRRRSAKETISRLAEAKIGCSVLARSGFGLAGDAERDLPIRFVFHRGVGDAELSYLLECLRQITR